MNEFEKERRAEKLAYLQHCVTKTSTTPAMWKMSG